MCHLNGCAGNEDTGERRVMKTVERIERIEQLLEKFQTNHWPHMTSRVARMEGILAVILALTLAVTTKVFLG